MGDLKLKCNLVGYKIGDIIFIRKKFKQYSGNIYINGIVNRDGEYKEYNIGDMFEVNCISDFGVMLKNETIYIPYTKIRKATKAERFLYKLGIENE